LAEFFDDKNISQLVSELNIQYEEKDKEVIKIIRKMTVDCLSANQRLLIFFMFIMMNLILKVKFHG
jgi:hypothetical protein